MKAGTRRQRIRRGARATGINDLPSALLDSIVASLELPDAVRASTVARSWRNCWKVATELNFNEDFYNEFIQGTEYQLDAVVNSILSRHVSTVVVFSLQVPRHFPNDVPIDINEGLRILSRKAVQSVTVKLENPYREYLELPEEIYNYSTLEQINLQHCRFRDAPANFDGFRELHWLTLSDVVVADNVLHLMMSSSPHLHRIELEFFEDGGPVEVCHAARDNLITLYYKCKSDVTRPLRLTALPELVEAGFETVLELPGRPFRTSKLDYFGSLIPEVEELLLGGSALASLADEAVPVRLSRPLEQVDELNLHFIDIGSAEQLNVAFCLMRSCPELETLTITVDPSNEDHTAAMAVLEAQRGSNPFPLVTNLAFKNVTAFFPIVRNFIETVCQLCPGVDHVRVWHGECIGDEDIEDVYEELLHIQLPEGARFMIDWNGALELITPQD